MPKLMGVLTVAPTNKAFVKEMQRNGVWCMDCWKNEKMFRSPANFGEYLILDVCDRLLESVKAC